MAVGDGAASRHYGSGQSAVRTQSWVCSQRCQGNNPLTVLNTCNLCLQAQNLLLGRGEDRQRVFLVDFGIACKYRDSHGFHKSDEPDERKAHDGTLEYTSRDAHTGAHSRRGDFETLGYNLVHWASGTLPWLHEMDDPAKVEASKTIYMENLVGFLAKCFCQGECYPPVLEEYLTYVNDMDFDSEPDYDLVRGMFEKCVVAMGKTLESKFIWTKPKLKKRRVLKSQSVTEEDTSNSNSNSNTVDQDEDSQGGDKRRSRRLIEAEKEEEDEEAETSNSNWNWESVLSMNPERGIGRRKKPVEQSEKEADFLVRQKESLMNPTPEMSRLLGQVEELELAREDMKDQDQLHEFNKQRAAWLKEKFLREFGEEELMVCENTPAMQEILDRINGVQRDKENIEKFKFKPVPPKEVQNY